MVITISGEWDEYRREKLAARLAPAYSAERLVLDMSGTVFLSDATADALADLHEERHRRHLCDPALVISSAWVRLELGLRGLDEAYELYWTLDAALAHQQNRV